MRTIIASGLLVSLFFVSCKADVKSVGSCGDGVLDPGEQCDGNELSMQDCAELGYYNQLSPLTCKADCTFELTACSGRCGDSLVQTGEEQCDDDDLNGQTCASQGYYGGTLACGADCAFDFADCGSAGRCGDGLLQEQEQCDGLLLGDATCVSLGYHGGDLACKADCTFELSSCQSAGSCGDGTLQESFEECEGSDLNLNTCESLSYESGDLACTGTCQLDTSNCCGDQVKGPAEECDTDDLGGATCVTLGYNAGVLSCSHCLLVETACAATGRCGDGVITAPYETCDLTALGGASCVGNGYFAGDLDCLGDCQFDESACFDIGSISAGDAHTCALDTLGNAWCWGVNPDGRLGNGTNIASTIPVAVAMPANRTFTKITAGAVHTCALDQLGAAWCWGNGYFGAIGDGTTSNLYNYPQPVIMPVGATFTDISANGNVTCAIDGTRHAWCWGDNAYGQLGTGNSDSSAVPAAVAMQGQLFFQISVGGGHVCALADSAYAWCWGAGSAGQLGTGANPATVLAPAAVSMPSGKWFMSIDAGSNHTCARDNSSFVYCWGENTYGQLGAGTTTNRNAPVSITASTRPFVSLSAGGGHTCGNDDTNAAWCWGRNDFGQLGNGAMINSSTPVAVAPAATAAGWITTGTAHTCAVNATGKPFCWGANSVGQLGIGNTTGSNTPAPVLAP